MTPTLTTTTLAPAPTALNYAEFRTFGLRTLETRNETANAINDLRRRYTSTIQTYHKGVGGKFGWVR